MGGETTTTPLATNKNAQITHAVPKWARKRAGMGSETRGESVNYSSDTRKITDDAA